jgi:antitoxin ParD1/3/4
MQIALTPALDQMVREKVASGLYESPSEVIREALRLMAGQDSGMDWLRKEAALGFEQLEAGECLEISREEFLQQMRERHPR